MKKLFSLTLSLLMLIACSLGTVSAFVPERSVLASMSADRM